MKVLLATDGSQCSEVALQGLVTLGNPQQVEVQVVHVVEFSPAILHIPELEDERSLARQAKHAKAEEIVAHARRVLENSGFHVKAAVLEGDPKSALIDAASVWHADLIIVGSHSRTGLDRLLMGSVSEAVARDAPCSVQIVRAAA